MHNGARKSKACALLNVSIRTLQRWEQEGAVKEDQRKHAKRQKPSNQLTDAETQAILDVCNSERFKSLPPCQIVPTLADEGIYMASESTFYRTLKAADQLHHRGRSQKPVKRKPTTHCATGSNQVWSWDITYLNSPIRGKYFYLYLVIDVFSRMAVAREIHEEESAENAAELIRKACIRHGIATQECPLVLHSDNGSPMKGSTMLGTLQALGVQPSFSRPRVSNDNPFSESVFKTLKYRPGYPPQAFTDLEHAQKWVYEFVGWYNTEHKHSGIKFLTPHDRHYDGLGNRQTDKRRKVYQAAKEAHPERWGSRDTRNWDLPTEVWLNPERSETQLLSGAA